MTGIPCTQEVIDYVSKYGGKCRECGDNVGVCPHSGLPCGGSKKAVRHVIQALNYGLANGFIRALPKSEQQP